ncbi:MAG: DUF4430 domain-containing protein [Clostridia bacterium]|nr:DUF4430 domain-containing protein [Clostridia bacterium]
MKTFLKNFIVPIIAIVLAIITMVCYAFFVAPKKTDGEKAITLKIEYLENQFEYEIYTNATTVYEVLVELNEVYDIKLIVNDSAYGKYVTSLKGVSEDGNNGYYYTYSIKGIDFASGISVQTIKDGDVITFKYSKDTYNENFELVSSELQGKGENDKYKTLAVVFCLVASILATTAIAFVIVKTVNRKKNNE